MTSRPSPELLAQPRDVDLDALRGRRRRRSLPTARRSGGRSRRPRSRAAGAPPAASAACRRRARAVDRRSTTSSGPRSRNSIARYAGASRPTVPDAITRVYRPTPATLTDRHDGARNDRTGRSRPEGDTMNPHRFTRPAALGLALAALAAPTAGAQQDLRTPDARDAAATSSLAGTTSAARGPALARRPRRRRGPRHVQRPGGDGRQGGAARVRTRRTAGSTGATPGSAPAACSAWLCSRSAARWPSSTAGREHARWPRPAKAANPAPQRRAPPRRGSSPLSSRPSRWCSPEASERGDDGLDDGPLDGVDVTDLVRRAPWAHATTASVERGPPADPGAPTRCASAVRVVRRATGRRSGGSR